MIEISSQFDSGAIRLIGIDGSDAELSIRHDVQADGRASEFLQWFHFRVSGAELSGARLRILNAGETTYPNGWQDYRAVASHDRRTWRRIPTSFDGQIRRGGRGRSCGARGPGPRPPFLGRPRAPRDRRQPRVVLVAAALGLWWQLTIGRGKPEPPFDPEGVVRGIGSFQSLGGWPFVVAAIVGVLVLIRILSVFHACVTLHGFALEERGDDLRVSHGLFTRVSATIPRHRIQSVTILEGPLHRLFGRVSLRVQTAGGAMRDEEGRGASRTPWQGPPARRSIRPSPRTCTASRSPRSEARPTRPAAPSRRRCGKNKKARREASP